MLALLISASILSSPGASAATQSARRPTLWYQTASGLYLRSASGSVRELVATADLVAAPAFSPDGTRAAWITTSGHVVLTVLAGGKVRTWTCADCDRVLFERDTLVAGTDNSASPRVLRYPANGSAPVSIRVTGLPKSGIPGLFELLTTTPAGQLIAGYGIGVSAAGGPQALYRISAKGKATPLTKHQVESNSIPFDFVYNTSGTHAIYVLPFEGGVCADVTEPVVATVATGAEIAPAMPKGLWGVAGAWFSTSGMAFAALARGPSGCATGSENVTESPVDYRQSGSRWVKVGTGTINSAAYPGGWRAVLSGKVLGTVLGSGGAAPNVVLTVTHGSSKVTIRGVDQFAFGWLP